MPSEKLAELLSMINLVNFSNAYEKGYSYAMVY